MNIFEITIVDTRWFLRWMNPRTPESWESQFELFGVFKCDPLVICYIAIENGPFIVENKPSPGFIRDTFQFYCLVFLGGSHTLWKFVA
jgi:hypothetical protein